MKKIWIILFSLPFLFSFLLVNKKKTEKNLIHQLLENDTSSIVKEVFASPEKYRLQIVYTQIDRDHKNHIKFKNFTFRTNQHEYFYPASMAKLPLAALTLEKINQLKLNPSVPLDSLRLLITDPKTGLITHSFIEDDIKKMFVVSNNSAFNNLYDFVGQEMINKRLWEMGYKDIRIIQKFLSLDSIGHRTSPPVKLLASEKDTIYQRGVEINPNQWVNDAHQNQVGIAFYDDRKLIKKPKDFSKGNYIPLEDLHSILISLIYPDEVPKEKRFHLSPNDHTVLKKYMSMYPREAGLEEWKDETIYYDSFRKYLLVGNTKTRIDSCLKIYNKVGQAYGFMTDCAYIKDYNTDIEFFLSATIYVNKNEIINDGKYEYNSIGFPFLERLGQIFYQHELKRTRKMLKRE
jgi:hypothetical protein